MRRAASTGSNPADGWKPPAPRAAARSSDPADESHSRIEEVMSTRAIPQTLEFPPARPPKPGETIEIRPGVFWARLALPFRLDHVNIYLIEDGDGLALVDAGIDNERTRAAWESLLGGPLAGRRLTRIIVTHFHPDHVGLAGWLCEPFGLQLAVGPAEKLIALTIRLDSARLKYHARHGFLPPARLA